MKTYSGVKKSAFQKIFMKMLFVFSLFFVHFAWSLASPPGSSPDEDAHLTSIYCVNLTGNTPCEKLNSKIVNIGYCFLFDSNQDASCDQYSTDQTSDASRSQWLNLYYLTLSKFAHNDIEFSTILMRSFNSFIITLVLTLIYFLLPTKIFVTSILTWLIVNLPLGFYLVSSINTTSWLLIFTLCLSLISYLIYEKKYNNPILIICGIFLFFLSKESRPDTVLITVIILFAFLPLGFIKSNKIYIQNFQRVISFLLFLYLLSLIWERSGIGFSNREVAINLWEHLYRVTSIPLGVFGGWGLGSLEIDMPAIVSVCSNFLILGVILYSLKYSNFNSNLSKIYLGLFIYLIPLFVIYKSKLQVGEWYQPRYILPLFIPLIFLSILDIVGDKKFTRNFIFIVGSIATVSYLFAIHTTIRRYAFGLDNFVLNLNDNYEWWWQSTNMVSPLIVVLLGVASYSYILYFLTIEIQKSNDFLNNRRY